MEKKLHNLEKGLEAIRKKKICPHIEKNVYRKKSIAAINWP